VETLKCQVSLNGCVSHRSAEASENCSCTKPLRGKGACGVTFRGAYAAAHQSFTDAPLILGGPSVEDLAAAHLVTKVLSREQFQTLPGVMISGDYRTLRSRDSFSFGPPTLIQKKFGQCCTGGRLNLRAKCRRKRFSLCQRHAQFTFSSLRVTTRKQGLRQVYVGSGIVGIAVYKRCSIGATFQSGFRNLGLGNENEF
jgi:hypothetical protein